MALMTPKITIVASGDRIDAQGAESALNTVKGLAIRRMEQQRTTGEGVARAVKWIAGLVGDTGVIVDGLIEQASKQFAGASLEVQVAGMTVKVTNANRSQLLEVMDKAIQAARDASRL